MGRVAGPWGVRGWVRIADPADGLAQCRTWWIGGAAYGVEETRPHSATLLARLAGVASREAARALKGKTVAVPRAALPDPEDGIYYYADLIGLEVVNADGVALGTVKALASYGAHEVMEVVAGERTRLLPWVAAVVKRVDRPARRIEVDWGEDW
jgi:16S rRNA processing protein RimM